MRLQTLEEKREAIAKKLAREAANERLLNRIERFENDTRANAIGLHPWAISLDGVGF